MAFVLRLLRVSGARPALLPAQRRGMSRLSRACMLALAAAAGLVPGLAPRLASAQIGSARYSSIIVDNGSGRVIEAANADAPRYPASLTKLMTLYMAFEALRDHRIALGQRVPVSGRAASMEPSKLGLVPGTYFTVSDAILAIVTKSANDAACALGELIGGGDEDRFAQMMTLRARALGMTNSTFRNASGLPDPDQITTARDLALLAHHLIQDFPDQYHYFSEPVFYFHGQAIPNHDRMLTAYEGADGLKTGYTQAAGHNLVTSALRGQVRLIGVVMGARSNPERDAHMANLLDDGFEQLGVPVTRHAAPRFRMPSLIASAEASTLTAAGYHPTLGRRQWRLHGHVAQVARHRGDPPLRATLAVARGPILSHGSLAHGSLAHAGMAHPGMAHASLSHASLAHAPRHLVAAHALSTCAARTLHHACGPHPREKRRT